MPLHTSLTMRKSSTAITITITRPSDKRTPCVLLIHASTNLAQQILLRFDFLCTMPRYGYILAVHGKTPVRDHRFFQAQHRRL